ncbi:MaoC family dehydratase [Carbonactinospora thermoautotrophica]|uniref:MaoC family dehydratase n=1 Tax=Carbonactinospora thermoautotrophica TaxID=1469144 RepID=UPI0008337254|nr:MaoC/PaaZ C-terminal domain-containing protein [Carbonactinospora thermoautotrophica]
MTELTSIVLKSVPNLAAAYATAVLTAPARRGGDRLPDLELVLPELAVDREHLAAYHRVCGFRLADELPVTYPHVLAFPLAMRLMTDRAFPFPLPGLVHLRNRITWLRPLHAAERITFRVRAEELAPHERGTRFDVVAEASVAGETVWTGRSTYLRRGGGRPGRPERRASPPAPTAVWRVPEDIGRRYAAVSGDRNPIHLHPLAARLFGFRRAIAHGMWVKARCLAALEGRLPEAGTVDVRFKLPVLLPATVAFAARRADGGWSFEVRDGGRPHLSGTVQPAGATPCPAGHCSAPSRRGSSAGRW